jgi:predicted TIM-barrel fold metal-dependent hydrolase
MPIVEVRPQDREIYERSLRDFLPDRLIDIHSHVWLARNEHRAPGPSRVVSWPDRVAPENPIEDHLESYRLLFPGKTVTPCIFAGLIDELSEGASNAYVRESARAHGLPALLFALPQWSGEEVERRMLEGGFQGIKGYLNLAPAYLPRQEIRVFDFLPPHQLQVMDRHGWMVMLHVPRDGRLRDPVNLAQVLEIEERFPHLQLVLAHVGRAYCEQDVGEAFQVLKDTRRLVFDFSANCNDRVFEQALRAVGPKRFLFGSDLPILRMRTRRICENGVYVNLVPRGLYGDVRGDRNMREIDGPEAERLTFFMYEELLALRRAAEKVGLSAADLRDVFYGNAARLLAAAGWRAPAA